jgi:hypothetical protein
MLVKYTLCSFDAPANDDFLSIFVFELLPSFLSSSSYYYYCIFSRVAEAFKGYYIPLKPN